jgi:hypothetical protein
MKIANLATTCSEFKGKAPVLGFFNFTTPYLLVTDPELAKQIMIKDFKSFRNNEFGSLVGHKRNNQSFSCLTFQSQIHYSQTRRKIPSWRLIHL